jgi:hypothetical protein
MLFKDEKRVFFITINVLKSKGFKNIPEIKYDYMSNNDKLIFTLSNESLMYVAAKT